jgi:alpha-tubulin suppressor-like RCC1 family protein
MTNLTFVKVAVGEGHMLALSSNGTVIAWGRNDYGR